MFVQARKVQHHLYRGRKFRRVIAQVQRSNKFVSVKLVGDNRAPTAMDFLLPSASPVFRNLRCLVYLGVYLLLGIVSMPYPH